MKRIFLIVVCLVATCRLWAGSYELISPDGRLKMTIEVDTDIRYGLMVDEQSVLLPSAIGLELEDGTVLGKNTVVKNTSTRTVNEIIPVVNGKNHELTGHYNELVLETEKFDLLFRAYDEGVAYRFRTALDGEVIIKHEIADFNFDGKPTIWFGEAASDMAQWERSYYPYSQISDIGNRKFAMTPCLLNYADKGLSVAVSESDLHDYPGMFVLKSGSNSLKGKWAEYPKRVQEGDYEFKTVLERYDYIAKTAGSRLYPWRVLIVAHEDKDLLNNQLIFKLARPQMLQDVSWVKPGKSAWEWWHDAILENVSTPSGPNNLSFEVYKYYIDFAAANGLEYVTLDAGWGANYVAQLCKYAAQKNVKVFLWYYFNLVVINPGILDTFKSYGAVGVKVDLINRDDQLAIQWFELMASECAKRQLMIIFHGCAKPTGLERAYPNIVNYEAVRGAECTKWDYTTNPNYHLQFPFMRMLAGAVDYTPGSMRNKHYEQFKPVPHGIPMSMGTRTHELAMYVMYDQPVAYLCDSPIEYAKYPDIMKYLSAVPTTWDRTLPLLGKIGEYAAIARQKGNEWYVGVMTNLEARSLTVDCSFLTPGLEYNADIIKDGTKADSDATDYKIETIRVDSESKINCDMVRGGGYIMRIYPADTDGLSKVGDNESVVRYLQDEQMLEVRSEKPVDQLMLTDMLGRTVSLEKNGELGILRVPLNTFPSGIYAVTIYSKQNKQVVKFLKAN